MSQIGDKRQTGLSQFPLESFIFIRNHAAQFETFSVTKALVMALPPPNAFFDRDWAICVTKKVTKSHPKPA
jgi:hypothetical protein